MKKKVLSLLLTLTMLLSLVPAFSVGASAEVTSSTDWYTDAGADTGDSEANPYILSDTADLEGLASLVNAGTANFSGKYLKLADSFVDTTALTTPIGKDFSNRFKGNFDGNSKNIVLNINRSDFTGVGLFGLVRNGTVKNVTTSGTLTVPSGTSSIYVGGIAGHVSSDSGKSTIVMNCGSSCTISATGTDNTYVGGVMGYLADNGSSVVNCYYCNPTATISATSTGASKDACVGGVVAYLSGTSVSNCYAIANALSATATNAKASGVVSSSMFNVDRVTNCYYHVNTGSCTGFKADADVAANTLAMTDEDMKATSGNTALVTKLNGYVNDNANSGKGYQNWKVDSTKNSGYPILYTAAPVCAVGSVDGTKYTALQEAINAATTPTVIYLLSNDTENVTVASGKTVTLDLNGYVLKADTEGSVITNNGTLYIADSDTTAQTHKVRYFEDKNGDGCYEAIYDTAADSRIAVTGGVITGGTGTYVSSDGRYYGGGIYNTGALYLQGGNIVGNKVGGSCKGGGVHNAASATFTMTGGAIIGNHARMAGGVDNEGTFTLEDGSISKNCSSEDGGGGVSNSGVLNMTGGTIANNATEGSGGAVSNEGGTFTMTGGSITGNTANRGGGIFNYCEEGDSIFTMTGGSITGNTASTGGGVLHAGDSCTLGGTAKITGNTADSAASNVYLWADKTVTVSTATPLTGTAKIGVTLQNTTGNVTGTNSVDYSSYFTSDDASLSVANGANNVVKIGNFKAQIVETGETYEIVQAAIDATTATNKTVKMIANSEESVTIANTQNITLDLNGYVLKAPNDSRVIENNGTLTIQDSNPTAVHYFTYHTNGDAWTYIVSPDSNQQNTTYTVANVHTAASGVTVKVLGGCITGGATTGTNDGGGIYNNGTLTVNGGSIVGNCSNDNGGGVYNVSDGLMVMSGGAVLGNTSDENGGGIYNAGVLSITDGTIAYNNVKKQDQTGGGVYNGGVMYMTGGIITRNHTANQGGGVMHFSFDSNALKLGGTAKIKDNTAGTITSNLGLVYTSYEDTKYYSSVAVYQDEPDTLKNGAEIGVTALIYDVSVSLYTIPAGAPFAVTGTNSADYSSYFTSDSASYKIYNFGSGSSQVVKLSAHEHTWTYGVGTTTSANDMLKAWCAETFGASHCVYKTEADAQTITIVQPTLTVYGGTGSANATIKDSKTALGEYTIGADAIKYEGTGSTNYTKSATAPTAAGTYKASITLGGKTAYVEYTIDKADSTISTTPAAKTGLAYTGSVQNLVSEGTVSHGTLYYAVADTQPSSGWTTTVPQGTDAKTYTVWYKVEGDTNYKDISPASVSVTIDKATQTVSAPTEKSKTTSSVTLNAVAAGQGAAKYGCNTENTAPTTWQTETEFKGLNASTKYYFFAKYEGNSNYAAAVSTGTEITTAAASFGSSSTSYTVTPSTATHGSITTSSKNAYAGNTVTLTVKADKGWTLETLTVKTAAGNEVALTATKLGETYTFTMPASAVTVTATFMEDNTMLNFFVDVQAADYYYDAVLWAAENGITSGVDATHFAPMDITTRGQMVTFLWRAAGSPEPTATTSAFTDLNANEYYYKAVLWGTEKGLIKGISDTQFAPNDNVTRGQCVAFLARYEGVKDEDTGYTHSFTDVAVSDYYNNAVAWAATNGITTGATETTFAPNNSCLRGEIVTFLYRDFIK